MPLPSNTCCTLSQRLDFEEIIDVRSPAEFAEDHIPGALNCPVLSDDERATVGTLYQENPFEARKIGAAMVARNIARHLDTHFADRPKTWRPLVYCWRGGMRSGSFVTWMRLIGWRAAQLTGGYKTWRREVLDGLQYLPLHYRWRVVCGATGSAKTRLLAALAAQGEQVLDLESLAAHKGSVLGALPDTPQPSQKMFETRLYSALQMLDRHHVVYVEAESRKIGRCALPDALIESMRSASCIELVATVEARLRYLLEDYCYLGDSPEKLVSQIERLRGFVDNDTLARWLDWAQQARLPELFAELIERHYDPLYAHSQYRHFEALTAAPRFYADDLSKEALEKLARDIVKACTTQHPSAENGKD